MFKVSGIEFGSPVVWAGAMAMCGITSVASAGIVADFVADFTPGTGGSAIGNAALGVPTLVDDGQTSPFNPPFHTTGASADITIIGPGGHITVHLSSPLHPVDGPDIGVFTNTGIAAASVNPVTAGTGILGMHDIANVSVSQDGSTWISLNDGQPLDLTMPSNSFIDGTMGTSQIKVFGGTVQADPFQPFTGVLSDYFGKTYPQMLTLLNGSFGGAWIDASSSGLSEIDYVRFDVPTGDRLVLDAVTGIPEPCSLAIALLGGAILFIKRR